MPANRLPRALRVGAVFGLAVAAPLGIPLAVGAPRAAVVTSNYDTPGGTGSLGPAAPGDAVTRAQIVARARDWVEHAVPYSESEGWQDSAVGGPYRMDCSGFISMAWGLTASMLTSTLPQVAAVTDTDVSGDRNIAAGDALDYTADHIVLFDHWLDGNGDFAYDAEHEHGQVTDQATVNIDDSTMEGYAMSDFRALRYQNLAGPPHAH